MTVQQQNLCTIVELKKTMAAITSTTSETSKTGAGLRNLRSAFAILTIGAVDVAQADEAYTITVEGRDVVGSGAYSALATFTYAAGAAVVGTFLAAVERTKVDMRVTVTIAGTTPSITYTCHLVAGDPVYLPGGTVISA